MVHFAVGKVVGEKASACAESIAGPGHIDVDFLNLDFKHVAGFGFGIVHRASENMASGALVVYLRA